LRRQIERKNHAGFSGRAKPDASHTVEYEGRVKGCIDPVAQNLFFGCGRLLVATMAPAGETCPGVEVALAVAGRYLTGVELVGAPPVVADVEISKLFALYESREKAETILRFTAHQIKNHARFVTGRQIDNCLRPLVGECRSNVRRFFCGLLCD